MRLLAVLVSLLVTPAFAVETLVKDAATIRLGDVTYRLAGIDAPELDQRCVNSFADPAACGVEARDALVKRIGGRGVSCRDLGPDTAFKGRRIGACVAGGDAASLAEAMVADGYALSTAQDLAAQQADAKAQRKGLWKGCFVAPQDFRNWATGAPLLGAACRDDKRAETTALLFPPEPPAPDGCSVKAKIAKRARLTGNVGVYQLRGCPSYASLTKPNRWFCSEDDARAAGFRKAFNCRVSGGR